MNFYFGHLLFIIFACAGHAKYSDGERIEKYEMDNRDTKEIVSNHRLFKELPMNGNEPVHVNGMQGEDVSLNRVAGSKNGDKRKNGSICWTNAMCRSGYCNKSNKCERDPVKNPTDRPNGIFCEKNSQCKSLFCKDSICLTKDGNKCSYHEDCVSGYCRKKKCKSGKNRPKNMPCEKDSQCKSGNCEWSSCQPKRYPDGSSCSRDNGCESDCCLDGECKPSCSVKYPNGSPCLNLFFCESYYCNDDKICAKKPTKKNGS